METETGRNSCSGEALGMVDELAVLSDAAPLDVIEQVKDAILELADRTT